MATTSDLILINFNYSNSISIVTHGMLHARFSFSHASVSMTGYIPPVDPFSSRDKKTPNSH